MNDYVDIIHIILDHYPEAQAIYLFGTYRTADERPDSDVDIAVLMPPEQARLPLMLTPCHQALEETLGRSVDLLNARIDFANVALGVSR